MEAKGKRKEIAIKRGKEVIATRERHKGRGGFNTGINGEKGRGEEKGPNREGG